MLMFAKVRKIQKKSNYYIFWKDNTYTIFQGLKRNLKKWYELQIGPGRNREIKKS